MRIPDLDIEALRAFVMVSDLGGFTAAADRLGRTQSAISVRIRKLEESLDCRLFERTSRSLALTREGERLLGYARRILAINDDAARHFTQPEVGGEIRIGVAEYFVPQSLARVLRQFARLHPRTHVEVRVGMSGQLAAAWQAGELDMVIIKDEEEVAVPNRLRGRVIRTEPLRWIASPDFLADWRSEHGTGLMDMEAGGLPPLPLCALPAPCLFRARGTGALDHLGRAWRCVYTSESVMGVLAAARAGLGVAVVGGGAVSAGLDVLTPADGFPDLGTMNLILLGEEGAALSAPEQALRLALVGFIQQSLRAPALQDAA